MAAPAVTGRQRAANLAARVLARTCLWSGGTILLAVAAGWIAP
jgi:hypothetical protein